MHIVAIASAAPIHLTDQRNDQPRFQASKRMAESAPRYFVVTAPLSRPARPIGVLRPSATTTDYDFTHEWHPLVRPATSLNNII